MIYADEGNMPDIELLNEEQVFSLQEDPGGLFELDESEGKDATDAPEPELPSNEELDDSSSPDLNNIGPEELRAIDVLSLGEADALELLSTESLGIAEVNPDVMPLANAATFEIKAQASGQLRITNKWRSAIIVSRNNGAGTQVAAGGSATLTVANGDTIKVAESSPGATFRNWSGSFDAFAFVSGVKAAITAMPAMSAFTTTSAGTIAGDNFFLMFNMGGTLTSLPAGSFDTSKIATAGNSFFQGFNSTSSLTSFPAGSFDLSRIAKAGDNFLNCFGFGSLIASLPASFKLPQNPSSVGNNYCFRMFEYSPLTHGNQSVWLYFAVASINSFAETSITPVSPTKGTTVKVNGQAAPKSYTVSYNANGGSGSVSSQTVTNGASFATRANSFTRSGYTFAGWNTQANGSGAAWAASAVRTYQATTNTTVYAQWKPVKPSITTTDASVHSGAVGANYKKTLTASGARTITWTRASGSLPPGLTLSNTGIISGKPTKQGTYSFTVKATNSAGSTTKTFTIKITAIKITTTEASVSAGITGINYNKTLAAEGAGTITWLRTSGSLPPGLKLSSAGVITGKPTKAGAYTFTVKAQNSAGSATKSYTIKVNNPSISISYQTHVQSIGWQAFKKDGQMSGTSGRALRLEGIKINLKNNTGISGGIRYSTHVQSIGWQSKVSLDTNGKSLVDAKGPMSGTSGRALRLEAITIELTGDLKKHYDIYYRVHAQNVGWMGWAKNNEQAGTAGHAYRLEGIQIVLVPKVGGKKPGNTFMNITTPSGTPRFIKK